MTVLGGLFFFVIVLWVRGCDSLLLIFPSIFRLLSHDPPLCCLVYFFNSVGFLRKHLSICPHAAGLNSFCSGFIRGQDSTLI